MSRPLLPAAYCLLPLVALATSACFPLILGAGAGAGYVGLQDRPVGQTTEDTGLKISLKNNLTRLNSIYLTDIGIDVYYGDVLLTGIVATHDDGEKVLDTVRRTPGVKHVYNELFVGSAYTPAQKTRDAWISAEIQPRLFGAKDAYPLNYLITVVNNNVYIMGSASTPAEHEHVLHILRTTKGVTAVHDYLTIANVTGPNHPKVEVNTIGGVPGRAPDPLGDSELK
jgi:osmotically-inducible protein OsmY